MIDAEFVLHGPKADLPVLDLHCGEYLLQKLEEHGDKVALVTEHEGVERSITYNGLLHFGKVVSCVLTEHGLNSGDTVMICCGNTLSFAPVYLGALFSGVTCSPVHPASGTDDFKHLLSINKPGLVFCDSESHRSMLEAVSQSDLLPSIMSLDVLARRLQHSTPDSVQHFKMAHIADVHDHVALVLTSSGTTGRPKGVEIAHATLLYMMKSQAAKLYSQFTGFTGMCISGPFWASGVVLHTMFISGGAKLVLLRQFQEKAFLETIQKYQINYAITGPDQVTALAKWPMTEDYEIPSLMFLAFGGSRITQAIQDMAAKRIKKPVVNGYGMSESMAVFDVAIGVVGKPGTVGTIMTNSSAKIVDIETGKNLGPNCEGELCFKTLGMLRGYRGNPEATKALFDKDGFLQSGDIGYYDNDGYFYIVDRIKELIKYKNIQVPAVDIEEVLMHHEGVKEAAVVGIQNDFDTEHSTAFVVRQPGATVSGQELVDLVEGKLPKHKWLYGGVQFLDTIPKTKTGKVQKRLLKALHAANIASGK